MHEPLYGAERHFAVVKMMRDSFPDVQRAIDIVADERCVAVCRLYAEREFASIAATGRKFSARVMNFYYLKGEIRLQKT